MSAMKVPFFRTPFNYDTKAASDDATVKNVDPSLTVQSMTKETDLNFILSQYQIGGKMPENPRIPVYGDFSHITDFQSAIAAAMEAQDGFMALPAAVRSRFDNDVQQMLEFLDNPGNVDEAIKLGLLNETAMRNRADYWKKDKEAKHAALLEAAHAAGIKFVEGDRSNPDHPPGTSHPVKSGTT